MKLLYILLISTFFLVTGCREASLPSAPPAQNENGNGGETGNTDLPVLKFNSGKLNESRLG